MEKTNIEQLKLLFRKAIFAGNTMLRHCSSIEDIIKETDDDQLASLAIKDKELGQLVVELESVGEKLGVE